MKKNYISLLSLVLLTSFCFAQSSISGKFSATEVDTRLSSTPNQIDPDFLKKKKFNQKAFLDTIMGSYFNFDGGAQGWSIVNNMPNTCQWQWDTVYPNGMFSVPGNIITSTTAANGFMVLPMDLCNTPIPAGGPFLADTYIESPTISLTNNGANPSGFGSVWVTYQQAMRYCCNGANRLVLQVSTDNFVTFQEFDATNAIAVNAASGTFSNVVDISSAVSNQTSMQVRFASVGNSHYYWMIDDFAVLEGPTYDLELFDPYPEFNADNYAINPFYSQIPLDLFNALYFSGIVTNRGALPATNARLEVSVTNDSTRNTPTSPLTGGLGLQYFGSTPTTPSNLPFGATDTLIVGINSRYVPTVLGEFTIDFLANATNPNQNPINSADAFSFEFTDRTMAKDDNGLAGALSPANFVDANGTPGGTAVGDELNTMFIVEPNANAFSQMPIPASVSFLVSLDSANIGVEISPKLYPFDENAATLAAAVGSEVASAFIPYTVQAADLGNWITIDFDNGTGFVNGLTAGQYMAGWETTSIANNTNFSVQQDQSSGSRQPGLTTLIDFGHSPGWGPIASTNPGIRLNFDSLSIPLVTSIGNITNSNAAFLVSPNPNNGVFTMDITTNSTIAYQLNVRNMLGQLTYSELVNVNNSLTKQLDLSNLEKGVYFVSLENEAEKIVKKVIIK